MLRTVGAGKGGSAFDDRSGAEKLGASCLDNKMIPASAAGGCSGLQDCGHAKATEWTISLMGARPSRMDGSSCTASDPSDPVSHGNLRRS